MGDLTNEELAELRHLYATAADPALLALLDMAERCAKAEAERDCYLAQCDYYKADLDAIRAMLPATEGVSTQDLVRGYVKAAGELLRAAQSIGYITGQVGYCGDHSVVSVSIHEDSAKQWNVALQAAERAGVRP